MAQPSVRVPMTDPRLDRALAQATEMIDDFRRLAPSITPGDAAAQQYLAGWAETIRALNTQYHHPINTCADWPSGKCAGCNAIGTFITAMLGGSDE